jgi:hypothetical protein
MVPFQLLKFGNSTGFALHIISTVDQCRYADGKLSESQIYSMNVENFSSVAAAIYYMLIDAWVALSKALLNRINSLPIGDRSEEAINHAKERVTQWIEFKEALLGAKTQEQADQLFARLSTIINKK